MQVATTGEQFSMFGTSHQVALVFLVAGAPVLVHVGRLHRGTSTGTLVGRMLAAAILLITIPLLPHARLLVAGADAAAAAV